MPPGGPVRAVPARVVRRWMGEVWWGQWVANSEWREGDHALTPECATRTSSRASVTSTVRYRQCRDDSCQEDTEGEKTQRGEGKGTPDLFPSDGGGRPTDSPGYTCSESRREKKPKTAMR